MKFSPRLVSVRDSNGDILIDSTTAHDRERRYDSHRVAARMATRNAPKPRKPMATRPGPGPAELPPGRYDFDDLSPATGIVVSAAIVAFMLFVLALALV